MLTSFVYREETPSSAALDAVWTIDVRRDCSGPLPYLTLPDGCVDLIYRLKRDPAGLVESAALFVAGPTDRPNTHFPSAGEEFIGLRFAPGWGGAALGLSASELGGAVLGATGLSTQLARLENHLFACNSRNQAVRLLESTAQRWAAERSPDRRTLEAVNALRISGGKLTVQKAAEFVGVSPRTFHRNVREIAGLSPKELSRIFRFRKALEHIEHHQYLPLTEIALKSRLFRPGSYDTRVPRSGRVYPWWRTRLFRQGSVSCRYAGMIRATHGLSRYGVDAPGLVQAFLLVAFGFGAAGFALSKIAATRPWAPWIAVSLCAISAYALGMFFYMLWGSLVTKVRGREAILDLIPWTGSEQILDVGCGRGLLLVGAAHRLSTGHALGIDLWLARDQSSNHEIAPLENARAEGVADRVSVVTGDMRELPFKDGSFDVVLSHWAVHNLESRADRTRALSEMVRVLRPGGAILLTDIAGRVEYKSALKHLGLNHVQLVIASKMHDRINRAVSFGSFQPATIVAIKD